MVNNTSGNFGSVPQQNVSQLKGKFEALAKKETQEAQKSQLKSRVITKSPPGVKTTAKSAQTGKIVETGSGDTVSRPVKDKASPLTNRGSSSTQSPSTHKFGRVLNRTGIIQTSFKQKQSQAPVLSRWPQANGTGRNLSAEQKKSTLQESADKLASSVSKLNLEGRKQSMNMSKISEQQYKAEIKETSKELADLYLKSAGDPKAQSQIKELQSKLSTLAEKFPDLKKEITLRQQVAEGLVETMDQSELKDTLDETVSSLCAKQGLSPDDITKEARLIGKDESTAQLKMAKRLVIYKKGGVPEGQNPSLAKRMDATGYELSVVKGVEKAFKHFVQGKVDANIAHIDNNITAIPTKGGMIVEEKKIGQGAFKAAVLASDFFTIKKPSDRNKFVTLKPLTSMPKPTARSATPPTQNPSTKPNPTTGTAKNPTQMQSDADIEDSGTFVAKDSGTMVVKEDDDSGTMVVKDEDDSGTMVVKDDDSGTMVVKDEDDSGTMVVKDEDDSGTMQVKDDDADYSTMQVKDDDADYSTMQVKDESDSSSMKVKPNTPENLVSNLAKASQSFNSSSSETVERPIYDLSLKEMEAKLAKLEGESKNIPDGLSNEKTDKETQIADLKTRIEKRKVENKLVDEMEEMDDAAEYEYEINITRELQGEHVIKMHSVIDLQSGEKVMIQEAAGFEFGSVDGLRDKSVTAIDLKHMRALSKSGKLSSDEKLQMMEMFSEGFKGVQHMHARGFIHRDLKEENFLVTKDGHCVLSDFGTVVRQNDDPKKSVYTGTPYYSAPETFKYDQTEQWNNVSEKCDVWSCGMMVLNSLLPGGKAKDHPANKARSPVVVLNVNKTLDQPANKAAYEAAFPEPEDKMSLEHLVWSATRIDPNERPTMAEFNERFDELMKIEKSKIEGS